MYSEVNGIQLFYEVTGTGPTVIFVHGNGEDHRIFDETAALLSNDHTVYALDSRDHGKSTKTAQLGYQDMADDVAALILKLHLEKPAFCGFSDGGIVGLLLASQNPSLLSRVVICGANTNPRGMKDQWYWLFWLISRFDHDPKIRMMIEEPRITAEELKRIEIPALILAGSHDMIKKSHTSYIASQIKGSSLKIIPGEGHGSYIVHSRKLYYLIRKFMGGDNESKIMS